MFRMQQFEVPSPTLDETLRVLVGLPDRTVPHHEGSLPVLYLLHGRGDTAESWSWFHPIARELMGTGACPPFVTVVPDGPWSDRAGWWVDSEHEHGRAIRSALTGDLRAWVAGALPVRTDRAGTFVAGYSMGGAGALHWCLDRPDVFGRALAVSPAVYDPQPPRRSNTRRFGAFGRGTKVFDPARYSELSPFGARPSLPVRILLAAGDDETPNAEDERHLDTCLQTALLHNRLVHTANVRAHLRIHPGGHDRLMWAEAFRGGLVDLFAVDA